MKRALLILLLSPIALADQISIPFAPQQDTVASAEEMATNLDTLKNESNENDDRIGVLEADVSIDSTFNNAAYGNGLQKRHTRHTLSLQRKI